MPAKSKLVNTMILKITAENISPTKGVLFSKFWFGLHDGTFDMFDVNERASTAIEQLAEDGNSSELMKEFSASRAGVVQATILGGAPPFGDNLPGSKISLNFAFDSRLAHSLYLSYGAMIIPSNDAFIANDNPKAYPVFDQQGQFVATEIIVYGHDVWDAGTEVNDELPGNTAGVGDPILFTPGAGVDEDGTIRKHPGYKPGGNILTNPAWAQADFTASGYKVAKIVIEQLALPSQSCLLL